MINIQIHNESVRIRDKWEEITLTEAQQLLKIAKQLPQHVIDLYRLYLVEDENEAEKQRLSAMITPLEYSKTLPSIYGEILEVLSDGSKELINKLLPEDRRILYSNFLLPVIAGLLISPTYTPKQIKSFNFQGVKYFLPRYKQILNQDIPGADLSAIEFTEVADLEIASAGMDGGRLENAAMIVAILCRPMEGDQREKYDENKAAERSIAFQHLPMNVIWEVFFWSAELSTISSLQGQRSLLEGIVLGKRKSVKGFRSRIMAGIQRLLKWRKPALSVV